MQNESIWPYINYKGQVAALHFTFIHHKHENISDIYNPPPLLLPVLLGRSATTARPGGIRSPPIRPNMDTDRLSACRPHDLCITLTPVLHEQFHNAWPLASKEGCRFSKLK